MRENYADDCAHRQPSPYWLRVYAPKRFAAQAGWHASMEKRQNLIGKSAKKMRRLAAEVLQATIDSSVYSHPRIGFFSSKHDMVTKADSHYPSHMKYVYLIRSKSHLKQRYIGITSDLKKRLIVQ